MQVPIHPMIVHFPMALTILLPILILIFALMIKNNKMSPEGWLIIIGLQLATVISGYVALETGENEEHKVETHVSKKLIHEHEEASEIFVGSTVLTLALSIGVFFIGKEHAFSVRMIITALSLVSCFLVYRTGVLGGELVYKHGAAAAYVLPEKGPEPTAPTIDEVNSPVEEVNESLKVDDHDYGNEDELVESPEDEIETDTE